jgi:hypothetical protein
MTQKEFLTMSYSALQAKTGIHPANWGKYFSGKRSMRLDTLSRAAKSLGMSDSQMLRALAKRIELNQRARANLAQLS